MNEETPPLRLKPRLRPESPAPLPTPTAPASGGAADPVSPADIDQVAAPERAKPRLSLSTPEPSPRPPLPPSPKTQPSSAEPPVEPVGTSPAPAEPMPPAASGETADPVAAIGSAPAGVPRPPQEVSLPHPHHVGAISVSMVPTAGNPSLPRHLHIGVQGVAPLDLVPAPTPRRPEEKPAFKFGVILMLLFALVALGGGAILAIRLIKGSIVESPPPPAPAARVASPVPSLPVETPPPALVDRPVSSIGKALARAHETTARATEQSLLTEIIETEPVTVSAEPGAVTEPLPPVLPKAPEPTHGQVVAESSATPAFIAFVESARISGVFQGDPPRALINGRTVRAGAIVDPALGVTFYRLDADRRWVFFRDATGAWVKKGY